MQDLLQKTETLNHLDTAHGHPPVPPRARGFIDRGREIRILWEGWECDPEIAVFPLLST